MPEIQADLANARQLDQNIASLDAADCHPGTAARIASGLVYVSQQGWIFPLYAFGRLPKHLDLDTFTPEHLTTIARAAISNAHRECEVMLGKAPQSLICGDREPGTNDFWPHEHSRVAFSALQAISPSDLIALGSTDLTSKAEELANLSAEVATLSPTLLSTDGALRIFSANWYSRAILELLRGNTVPKFISPNYGLVVKS